MKNLKVRIVGDPRQMEQMTEILRDQAKVWGKRKLFSIRRYKRQNNPKAKYDRSFGGATHIYYVRMTLPEQHKV